ncbi:hypothetical protein T265_12530 [Opisthorchis viverrini]|uniref:LicD/FKTN/FKRP nucleotidyltransferase domain-containing protein n=1 Tax=Opisthorchis viverrini TaxID=6198 RepID=A0A075A604_OPIVI|nr:hypothetical protein T265_12530 [Opisthorchis viverrini]KER33732.1 hypothetical protein T265_12530 [Opisthorchis viverrini]
MHVSEANAKKCRWFYCGTALLILLYIAFLYLIKYSNYRTRLFRQEITLIDSESELQDMGDRRSYRLGSIVEYVGTTPVWRVSSVEQLYKRMSWTSMQLTLFVLLTGNSFARKQEPENSEHMLKAVLFDCQPMAPRMLDKIKIPVFLYKNCFRSVSQFMTLGSIPDRVANPTNIEVPFNVRNPIYNLSRVYLLPLNKTSLSRPCPIVSASRRESLYRTLQDWIRIANQSKILWWITYGTLLGSWRDGNMIPYDSDVDISILGSYEKRLRELATDRKSIQKGKFNLVTRPGEHCVTSPGLRLDCGGRNVTSLRDTCSFCGPLARMFRQYGEYIDIYPVHLEVRMDVANNPIEFGYLDEGMDRDRVEPASVIFPLRNCKYMGLNVPCPNDPERFLTSVYGKEFALPKSRCSQETGRWT